MDLSLYFPLSLPNLAPESLQQPWDIHLQEEAGEGGEGGGEKVIGSSNLVGNGLFEGENILLLWPLDHLQTLCFVLKTSFFSHWLGSSALAKEGDGGIHVEAGMDLV